MIESNVFKMQNESEHADANTPVATGSPAVTLAETPDTSRARSNPSIITPICGGLIQPVWADASPHVKSNARRADLNPRGASAPSEKLTAPCGRDSLSAMHTISG